MQTKMVCFDQGDKGEKGFPGLEGAKGSHGSPGPKVGLFFFYIPSFGTLYQHLLKTLIL